MLGGPGSGKTTLLESFAMAAVRPGLFPWGSKVPRLLPVFLRVRELDPRVQEQLHSKKTLWDFLQDYACAWMDDDEIQEFTGNWSRVHYADPEEAAGKAKSLWQQIEGGGIKDLARNALLLTMITKVHFGAGVLPDNRLELYEKCSEMLLGHWAKAAGLGESPLEPETKAKFLSQLAFEMQEGSEGHANDENVLLISRHDLEKKLGAFLKEYGEPVSKVGAVIERLHNRDAILVDHGGDQFGFVHRSFQEYFAAYQLVNEGEEELERLLDEEPAGWAETLYLAVAQMKDSARRRVLVDLLAQGRVPFALRCVRTGKRESNWLGTLARFLSRCYWDGVPYKSISAAQCADAVWVTPEARKETLRVLVALFEKAKRDGRALYSALELAEELRARGIGEVAGWLDGFFSEARACGLDQTGDMAPVDGFYLDKHLVTNRDYEQMIPSHKERRGEYSDQDDQPVIYVNWYEAQLFCRWRGKGFRLPTEKEWYRAASWDPKTQRNRKYPWGDKFERAKCNTYESGLRKTTPVSRHPDGASFYRCLDMAGNVWEWSNDWFDKDKDWKALRGVSNQENVLTWSRTTSATIASLSSRSRVASSVTALTR